LLIDCIESELRRHMTPFTGVQETENLITRWEEDGAAKKLIAVTLPTSKARYRFTCLIRNLIEERVPVSDWEALLGAAKEAAIESEPLADMVRAARLRLRSKLPGNSGEAVRVPVPAEFEHQLHGATDSRFSRARASEFLVWLREEMQNRDGRTVLVTRPPDLRPLLRRFIAPEFPDLMVLAEEELVSLEQGSVPDGRELVAAKDA
jgi:flagellar biosynthesis component FlhA